MAPPLPLGPAVDTPPLVVPDEVLLEPELVVLVSELAAPVPPVADVAVDMPEPPLPSADEV